MAQLVGVLFCSPKGVGSILSQSKCRRQPVDVSLSHFPPPSILSWGLEKHLNEIKKKRLYWDITYRHIICSFSKNFFYFFLFFIYWFFLLKRERGLLICCAAYSSIHWLILSCTLTGDLTAILGVSVQCSNQLSHLAGAVIYSFKVYSSVVLSIFRAVQPSSLSNIRTFLSPQKETP